MVERRESVKNIIIIAGHGNFGSGMKSTLSFIAGEQPDVYGVDFGMDMTEEDLVTQYQSIIDENIEENIVFVCDLLGGTPFKAAASIVTLHDQYELVCGCTVASLIESVIIKDSVGPKVLASLLVEKSIASCYYYKLSRSKTIEKVEYYEDGI
ncbi:MAG TPA: PTS fructose transporter subunit IIA [Firmicutes bacterium]|nr:PTS fructose transporter subunit IIA [Bacillota bacterium]